jgi:hypothetical protein
MRRIPCSVAFLLLFPLWVVGADPIPKAAERGVSKADDAAPAGAAADQAAESDSASSADTPKQRKISVGPTSMAIVSEPSGMRTLTIHFPWSLFPDASIEVRLVPASEAKGKGIVPIYFHEHLKGKVQEDFFDCLDHADNGGKTHSFTKDKLVYTMIGRRNGLGNQGVHVQVASEKPKKPDNPAAAYLQLDTWAVDKKTLSLELPRDEFAQPGTLFVWFFRGEKTVWHEQIRWPGYK